MITTTGWTWEHIDTRVYLPQLLALMGYWKRNPPLHLLAKGYLGIKDEEPAPKQAEAKEQGIGELIRMFDGGVLRGR